MMINRGLRRELTFLSGLASIGLLLMGRRSLAATLALGTLGVGLMPSNTTSYARKSVIITGGSRGLGLALAKRFLMEGAYVTLLARDDKELERARYLLKQQLPTVDVAHYLYEVVCDVTDKQSMEVAFANVERRFDRIDVLVNNAGVISVGPFETMEHSDFDAMIDLQVHSVISAVELAIPAFCKVGGGQIINISSIGGQLPLPHLSSYCAGKYAIAGLSETLAAELGPRGIQVTTVYPGMMRTGSTIQAIFKGNTQREYAWFTTGNLIPGLSVSAAEAAKRIVDGARHGDLQVIFPLSTQIGIWSHRLFPETFGLVTRAVANWMPKPPQLDNGRNIRATGAASKGWLESQPWYKWNPPLRHIDQDARRQQNQEEKFDPDYNLGLS